MLALVLPVLVLLLELALVLFVLALVLPVLVLLLELLLFVGSIGAYTMMPKGAVDNSSSDFVGTTLSYSNNTPIKP
ncbi:hypothetical protein AT960_02300 [Priestia megaterium]|nr:hypothetical protein AT960_02300 [Priestia megaterium]